MLRERPGRAGSCGQRQGGQGGGSHRNRAPNPPAGSGSRWHRRHRAGIATVPVSPRAGRTGSHPTSSCIFHPQRCPGVASLTLGRKSSPIPKLSCRSKTSTSAGFPYPPMCNVVGYSITWKNMDLSLLPARARVCSHTPFRCNYIRNPFAKRHSGYLGAY